jgi:hypothetical protein
MNAVLQRLPVLILQPHSRCNGDGEVSLVTVAGRNRLIAADRARQLRRFQLLHVEGLKPVLVDANVPTLRAGEKHLGSHFRLAGKRVLA